MAVVTGSMLVTGCDGTAGADENALAQTRQTVLTGASPKVAAGRYHGLAVRADEVWSWGYNEYGQLGDGTTATRSAPVKVPGLTGINTVAAGCYFSLALKSDGTVWSWGHNNHGQLGNGGPVKTLTPAAVQNGLFTNVAAIAAGCSHSLVLKSDGSVWSWGYNANGELGDGTTVNKTAPVQVETTDPSLPKLTGVVAIAAGSSHNLAVRNDGTVWAWGSNGSGRLGIDNSITGSSTKAVRVQQNLSGSTAVDVAAGQYHSLVLLMGGSVYAFGDSSNRQTGYTNTSWQPRPVTTLSGVTQLAAGMNHSLALVSGGVMSWGANQSGALGHGVVGWDYATPAAPAGSLSTVSFVAASERLSVSRSDDGTVRTWGDNNYGQLGRPCTGTSTNYDMTPAEVKFIPPPPPTP